MIIHKILFYIILIFYTNYNNAKFSLKFHKFSTPTDSILMRSMKMRNGIGFAYLDQLGKVRVFIKINDDDKNDLAKFLNIDVSLLKERKFAELIMDVALAENFVKLNEKGHVAYMENFMSDLISEKSKLRMSIDINSVKTNLNKHENVKKDVVTSYMMNSLDDIKLQKYLENITGSDTVSIYDKGPIFHAKHILQITMNADDLHDVEKISKFIEESDINDNDTIEAIVKNRPKSESIDLYLKNIELFFEQYEGLPSEVLEKIMSQDWAKRPLTADYIHQEISLNHDSFNDLIYYAKDIKAIALINKKAAEEIRKSLEQISNQVANSETRNKIYKSMLTLQKIGNFTEALFEKAKKSYEKASSDQEKTNFYLVMQNIFQTLEEVYKAYEIFVQLNSDYFDSEVDMQKHHINFNLKRALDIIQATKIYREFITKYITYYDTLVALGIDTDKIDREKLNSVAQDRLNTAISKSVDILAKLNERDVNIQDVIVPVEMLYKYITDIKNSIKKVYGLLDDINKNFVNTDSDEVKKSLNEVKRSLEDIKYLLSSYTSQCIFYTNAVDFTELFKKNSSNKSYQNIKSLCEIIKNILDIDKQKAEEDYNQCQKRYSKYRTKYYKSKKVTFSDYDEVFSIQKNI